MVCASGKRGHIHSRSLYFQQLSLGTVIETESGSRWILCRGEPSNGRLAYCKSHVCVVSVAHVYCSACKTQPLEDYIFFLQACSMNSQMCVFRLLLFLQSYWLAIWVWGGNNLLEQCHNNRMNRTICGWPADSNHAETMSVIMSSQMSLCHVNLTPSRCIL